MQQTQLSFYTEHQLSNNSKGTQARKLDPKQANTQVMYNCNEQIEAPAPTERSHMTSAQVMTKTYMQTFTALLHHTALPLVKRRIGESECNLQCS